jgi:hypothetical protein
VSGVGTLGVALALVVTDWLGFVRAREGDLVRLGSSEFGDSWHICDGFEARSHR